jgi:hypothetical protein
MAKTSPFGNTKNVGRDESYTEINPGPYVAIVKDNIDQTKMGRLRVLIPSLSSSSEPFDSELITVEYLPPFYGAKSPESVRPSNVTSYADSQHSYGMWMVPPDIDTKVLVTFVEGKISQGYWIGCVQEPFVNNMVPGIASSTDTFTPIANTGGYDEPVTSSNSKVGIYGAENLPAGEVNRGIWDSASQLGFDKLKKPVHPFANTLRDQGLVQDTVRGNTTSSARRESPSNVFGISTPGPVDSRSPNTKDLGPRDAKQKAKNRKTGHSFVMDDGDNNGDNHLIRLRTSSGHQLLMHDSAGVMYLANSEGTVWMEFSNNGMVDVYAQTGYNLRSGADINFHAEGNINMYANKNIKIKANEKTGSVSIDAGRDIKQIAEGLIRFQGQHIYSKAFGDIAADAGSSNIQQGKSVAHMVGGQVHLNGIGVTNLVPSMFRTNFTQPGGTGTATTDYPDVSLKPVGSVYEVDRALRGMSGMRIPTHEPFWGHQDVVPAFGAVGGTDVNVGTAGWIEEQNRNADLSSVRWAQYKADLDATLLKDENLNKISDSVISIFNASYSTTYSVDTNYFTSGVQDYKALPELVSETYQQLTSGLNTSGNTLTNVLINESGVLYTKGTNKIVSVPNTNKVSGTLNKVSSTVNTIGTLLSSGPGTNVGGNPINTLSNLTRVTDTYKNVVGGKVTSVIQTASAVSTVGSTIAKVATVARSIGSFFSGFSDVRLKENIQLVGKSPTGINIYSFKYKQLNGTYEGVMAQEVPWAREMTDTGFYMVDYSKVDVEFRRLN